MDRDLETLAVTLILNLSVLREHMEPAELTQLTQCIWQEAA